MESTAAQDKISDYEFSLFRDYISENSGISIPPEKSYLIETRLTKLMLDAGADSFEEFYKHIMADPKSPMHQRIINAITTNETLWFRDSAPWKVLEEIYLPRLVEDLRAGMKARARVWCAAVSTGQEIYSTVMCVDDFLSRNRITDIDLSCFDFFATDISGNALDIAKKGRYDSISIKRGLSDYYRKKYFIEDGSAWNIKSSIRDAVKFERFNLQDSYFRFGLFDIVFCRYVMIYFSDDLKREIVEKMRAVLADDGVLFTGNYALFDFFKDDFDTNHYGNLTYYTGKERSQ